MHARRSALVVFGTSITKPTIVCIAEDALPVPPPEGWLILVRDRDLDPEDVRADSCHPEHPPRRGLSDSGE